jgi:triosephosphate isomerase (TIM)
MARKPIIAGNWKMNTTAKSAADLVEGIKAGGLDAITGVEKILCPPFPYLPLVAQAVAGTSLRVGAQNLFWEEKGAFTGEVSAAMLQDFATHVIIAHSERRAYFGETDETANKKVRAALAIGLTPILCVGETGSERQADQTRDVLRRQVRGGLEGIEFPASGVIAYEPVWAIGTGRVATSQQAQEAHAHIRGRLRSWFNDDAADQCHILYGGSVKPDNIAELAAQPDVDGALVGGASLA